MKYKILFGFMILAFVTSCNKKNTNRGVNTRLNELGGTLNSGLTCVNGNSNVGTIYDSNGGFSLNGTASFEDRVKALLSATINPSEIGTISAAARACLATEARASGSRTSAPLAVNVMEPPLPRSKEPPDGAAVVVPWIGRTLASKTDGRTSLLRKMP